MANFGRDDRGQGGFRGGFNRGGRGGFGGGRSSFGGGRGFDRGGRGNREMFKTTCSNCGKECEVPFRPTNGKPVYCSDCFEKMGGGRNDSQRPERSNFRSQGADQNKAQLEAINAKLDRILGMLEPKAPKIVAPVVVNEDEKVEVEVKKAPKVKKTVKKSASVK